MVRTSLTPAEENFRRWMGISALLYGLSALQYLALGEPIPFYFNEISKRLFSLPLYPLPSGGSEGAFWRVLAVSMMAMITWICLMCYRDLRGYRKLIGLLLLSKLCSTLGYLWFFCFHPFLAYLVGGLVDGSLLLITVALWVPAIPEDRVISRVEEDILMAAGDALIPRGGAFAVGFSDLREACLKDARRFFVRQPVIVLVFMRAMLHVVDLCPLFLGLRFARFRNLPGAEREALLSQLEAHRLSLFRWAAVAVKLAAVLPFFNQKIVEQAIGIGPEAAT